jgi:hypothetical protein
MQGCPSLFKQQTGTRAESRPSTYPTSLKRPSRKYTTRCCCPSENSCYDIVDTKQRNLNPTLNIKKKELPLSSSLELTIVLTFRLIAKRNPQQEYHMKIRFQFRYSYLTLIPRLLRPPNLAKIISRLHRPEPVDDEINGYLLVLDLLAYKFLNPFAIIVSYPYLGVAAIQDVGTMTRAVHPLVHHFRRARLAFGDVFPCRVIGDPECSHHIKRGSISRRLMIKIIIVVHILSLSHRYFRETAVQAKGIQTCFRSFLIHQIQHLLRRLGWIYGLLRIGGLLRIYGLLRIGRLLRIGNLVRWTFWRSIVALEPIQQIRSVIGCLFNRNL